MTRVTLEEARERLDALLTDVARGEEVLIAREDGSAFRIVPVGAAPGRKRGGLGIAKGQIWMAEDFDEIPEGFEEYMP